MTSAGSAWLTLPVAALVSLAASVLLVGRHRAGGGPARRSRGHPGAASPRWRPTAPRSPRRSPGLIRGQRAIGVGVVLGSNVFNLAALLGVGALRAGRIRLHRDVVVFSGGRGRRGRPGQRGHGDRHDQPGARPRSSAWACSPSTSRSPRCLPARWRGLARRAGSPVAWPGPWRTRRRSSSAAIRPRPGGLVDGAGGRRRARRRHRGLGADGARGRHDRHPVPGARDRDRRAWCWPPRRACPTRWRPVYLAGRGRGSSGDECGPQQQLAQRAVRVAGPGGLRRTCPATARPGLLVAVWYAAMTAVALVLAYRGRGLARALRGRCWCVALCGLRRGGGESTAVRRSARASRPAGP